MGKWVNRRWPQVAISLLALTAYFAITGSMFDEVCPSKIFFGVPCPGCGLTRAGVSMARLDFAGAWKLNPMIYSLPLLSILWVLSKVVPKICIIWEMTLITMLILSMVVFLLRLPHSFGEEPFTLNEKAVFFPLVTYVFCVLRI
jgi:hypothetical protein